MKSGTLTLSDGLLRLIQANAPFWSGEAEVIRSYWDSSVRNRETDRKWLIHQIYKEYWDGILPPLELFNKHLVRAGLLEERLKLLAVAEVLHEEVAHFALFADLYQVLEGTDCRLSPDQLQTAGCWSENDALMALRKIHKSVSPELGQRAQRFTEGGYCALFTEGMKLAERGGFDSAVAEVCRKIYADEFNHMLLGIIDTDDNQLSGPDWKTLNQYTVAQMKKRIVMRNAQFSNPVSTSRLNELLAGKAKPIDFDFEYAAQLPKKQTAQR